MKKKVFVESIPSYLAGMAIEILSVLFLSAFAFLLIALLVSWYS
ncbi:MAG: hypothetical protein QMD53_01785 [Actinomycetota bacterium]|nr:hypothetical protein [Actinomycetota bacterium]